MATAAGLGRETGLFRVPEVREYDEVELKLTIEYIPRLVPLARVLLEEDDFDEVLGRLGRTFGLIHNATWRRPDGVVEELFHGDPDAFNIGIDESGTLTLIDWDPAPGLEGVELSPREKDLGLMQLYLTTALIRRRGLESSVGAGLVALLSGYRELSRLDDTRALEIASAVGRELGQWSNLPPVSLFKRLYYRSLRRRAVGVLGRVHPAVPVAREAQR